MNWTDLWARFMSRRVIIYADFIDPFCYIGVHNLWTPLETSKSTFDWCGFELNPETPPEGMILQSADNSDLRPGMWASVKDFAERSGLKIVEPKQVPNTRRAQLLVRAVNDISLKKSLIERLYQAYFIDQKDIGNVKILRALAKDLRVPLKDDEPALDEELPTARPLEKNRADAMRRSFAGMPGFVHHGKTFFGALSQDRWQEILKLKVQKG